MFIGWLKPVDFKEVVAIADEVGWLLDAYHLKILHDHTPHLCYGAYDNETLVGVITSVKFEKSAMIKYFMVKGSHQRQGIGRRLLETLLSALGDERETLYTHAPFELIPFFKKYGFTQKMTVGRYVNAGKVPPFNFTNAHAKELDSIDFDKVMKQIDYETFHEVRTPFLFDELERKSSLKLATPNGFQHSSVINARNVYLGPWQVRSGAYSDAEKMMRGLLYFRGLKKVIADIPHDIPEIRELYEKYHFKCMITMAHMIRGKDPEIRFENIYAFTL
jgi:GNAT superfamily N-acetyltransferase